MKPPDKRHGRDRRHHRGPADPRGAGPRARHLGGLRFALDHARAREAVLAGARRAPGHRCAFAVGAGQPRRHQRRRPRGTTISVGPISVAPCPRTRWRRSGIRPVDVAIVLGDGLSGIAANLSGPAFVAALAQRLTRQASHDPVILAHQARVALGDPSRWPGRKRWSWRWGNAPAFPPPTASASTSPRHPGSAHRTVRATACRTSAKAAWRSETAADRPWR
jgi:hypothetical protein